MNALARMKEMAQAESAASQARWDGHIPEPPRPRKKYFSAEELAVLGGFDSEMRRIIAEVSQASGVSSNDILGKSRKPAIARARQLCMWKAHKLGHSLSEIGGYFQRDHTTVLHAVRTIDKLMEAGGEH